MSWEHLSYAAMLGFCLAATLPLIPFFRLHLPWRRVLLTTAVAGTPFLVWDILVTRAGHWWFDADQLLPPRILGLPMEEIAFFLVIPFVSIITLEGVRTVLEGANSQASTSEGGR